MWQKGGSVRSVAAVVGLSFTTLQPPVAWGLDINLTFASTANNPPEDPNGQNLIRIMEAAASMWEDIIEDDWSFSVVYLWGQLNDPSGFDTYASHIPTYIPKDGRPVAAQITFDVQDTFGEPSWYFDPTPFDHSEYDMRPTFYGDLTEAQQDQWFDGTPPNQLEVSFQGMSNGSAATNGRIDLLSTALHELGHALGMSSQYLGFETADNDYDLNPDLIGGFTAGATVAGLNDPMTPVSVVHLEADSLMNPSGAPNIRHLPSALDVLAVATAPTDVFGGTDADWKEIDLPRKEFLNGVVWEEPSNWVGGRTPDAEDDVGIRGFAFTSLVTDTTIQNLTLADDVILTVSSHLRVQDTATFSGPDYNGTTNATELWVQPGGRFETNNLVINGGVLDIDKSGEAVVQRKAFVDQGGVIRGYGSLFVAEDLINNGAIRAEGVGALTLRSGILGLFWDLDGDLPGEPGSLDATLGSLEINARTTSADPFDGRITLRNGNYIFISSGLKLGERGTILFEDSAVADPLEIRSFSDSVINGTVEVETLAKLVTPVTFDPSTQVQLTNSDAQLDLVKSTIFNGGRYEGVGTLRQLADVTVLDDTTIDSATYDWGNGIAFVEGSGETTIEGVTFTVNSRMTGTPDNEYRGVMRVNVGHLIVNTDDPWTLPAAHLRGSEASSHGIQIEDRDFESDVPYFAVEIAEQESVQRSRPIRLARCQRYRSGARGDLRRIDRLRRWPKIFQLFFERRFFFRFLATGSGGDQQQGPEGNSPGPPASIAMRLH